MRLAPRRISSWLRRTNPSSPACSRRSTGSEPPRPTPTASRCSLRARKAWPRRSEGHFAEDAGSSWPPSRTLITKRPLAASGQDSPRASLGDIRAARLGKRRPGRRRPRSPPTTRSNMPNTGTTPGVGGQDKSQVKQAQARQLVLDGYKALEGGDLVNARRLGEQAQGMNAGFEQWEPNPENLLADVQRQSATAQATAGATDARGMLRSSSQPCSASSGSTRRRSSPSSPRTCPTRAGVSSRIRLASCVTRSINGSRSQMDQRQGEQADPRGPLRPQARRHGSGPDLRPTGEGAPGNHRLDLHVERHARRRPPRRCPGRETASEPAADQS